MFADWYDQLDQRRVTETHQGLQAVYSKMQGYTGRLALMLHCLNAAVDGCLPAETVSAQTMKAAIKLARWFIGQVKLLYAEGDAVDGALGSVYTKLIQLSRVRGWLRAKDVRNYERNYRKASSEVIRSHFRELEAMGYGETCGVGNRLQWRATVDAVDGLERTVDGVSTAERVDRSGLQGNGRSVDGVEGFSEESVDGSGMMIQQRVYRSTKLAEETDGTRFRAVDRVSTEGLPGDAVSTEGNQSTGLGGKNRGDRPLQVGDICQYVGTGLKQLKGLNRLRIEAIASNIATIKGAEWCVSHEVPLSDLRLNPIAE